MRVLVDWDIPERERAILATWPAGIEIVEGGSRLTPAGKLDLAAGIDVHCGLMRTVTREYLDAATTLRLVQLTGHGVDLLLRDGIPDLVARRGLRVATADGGAIAIAEHAVMAMILLCRQTLAVHHALSSQGRWEFRRGPDLHGATLCIVGYGSIGQTIATRARAFGMKVGVVTRNPGKHASEELDFALSYEAIDLGLARADHVVVTAPLTSLTEGMFDSARLGAMQPGAYLTSITRGPVIVERALHDALASGHLAGAALDCWWREEETGAGREGYPADLPLHQFNVLMTPHCAGTTFGTRERALATVGANIGRLMRGEPLENEITAAALKDMAS